MVKFSWNFYSARLFRLSINFSFMTYAHRFFLTYDSLNLCSVTCFFVVETGTYQTLSDEKSVYRNETLTPMMTILMYYFCNRPGVKILIKIIVPIINRMSDITTICLKKIPFDFLEKRISSRNDHFLSCFYLNIKYVFRMRKIF